MQSTTLKRENVYIRNRTHGNKSEILDKPNINPFTSTPNGNYGNGFDNQEIGEFGYCVVTYIEGIYLRIYS